MVSEKGQRGREEGLVRDDRQITLKHVLRSGLGGDGVLARGPGGAHERREDVGRGGRGRGGI